MLYISYLRTFKNIFKYLLISVLTGTMMFICVTLYTTYEFQSARYTPFKERLDGKGHLIYTAGNYICFSNTPIQNEFRRKYPKVSSISYTLTDSIQLTGLNNVTLYGYDDEICRYRPYLSEGRWFDEDHKEGCISAVVTPMPYVGTDRKVKAGDVIEYEDRVTGEEIDIYVTGVLGQGASYYAPNKMTRDINAFKMYSLVDQMTDPIVIMSDTDIFRFSDARASYQAFIRYQDDITEEEMEQYRDRFLSEEMATGVESFADIRTRTKDVILLKIGSVLPLAAVSMAFILIAVICAAILNSISEIRDDAILYMSGMTTAKITLSMTVQSIGLSAIGFTLTLGLAAYVRTKTDRLLFELGGPQILLCLAVVAVFSLITMLIKYTVLRKNSAVSIIRKADT